MRWYFSLDHVDGLCVKEHEHWYSVISSEFIIHNTRVIGLQIASKETWKRSLYCIFGVIGDVKCTYMVGLKGKSAPRAASVTVNF